MDEKQPSENELRSVLLHASTGSTWVQWPRYLDALYFRYKVPPSCIETIRSLWSACFGPGWPFGTVALSQIPVEAVALRKWIAALVATGIFTYSRAAVLGDQKGSEYMFTDHNHGEWESFFKYAAYAVSLGGLEPQISVEQFARFFTPLHRHSRNKTAPDSFNLRDGTPGSQIVEVDAGMKDHINRIIAACAALPLRPKKKGGPKPKKKRPVG